MKANLKQLEEIQKELFKQQCDLDIHKAMVKHFIKKKRAEQLTLTDVSSMFSAKQMEQAYNDGVEAEQQRCGEFDIENYC